MTEHLLIICGGLLEVTFEPNNVYNSNSKHSHFFINNYFNLKIHADEQTAE